MPRPARIADQAAVDAPLLPGARPSAPGIRLDQPALTCVDGPPTPDPPMWDDAARQAIVQFLDRSWRLCRLTAWQQRDDDTWLCELRWGVSGRLYQARYVYDPARVRQVN